MENNIVKVDKNKFLNTIMKYSYNTAMTTTCGDVIGVQPMSLSEILAFIEKSFNDSIVDGE